MPIYEYECPQCGTFEYIQKVSDKTLTSCPMCKEKGKKSKVERKVSASSFHLKGSGWYKTDYSSSNKGSSSKSASDSEGSSSSGSSDKGATEAKSTDSGDAGTKRAACGGGCTCH